MVEFSIGGAEVLVRCELPAPAVEVDHRSDSRLALTPAQTQEAADHCRRLRAGGVRADPLPLYKVESWHLQPDRLVIRTGATDYGEYLACDTAFPDWGLSACPLSISAVTECHGHLLLEERSLRVAVLPGHLNVVPSGHVHPPQPPFEAMLEEAREELGLEPEEITRASCLGLMRMGGCYEVVYSLEASPDLSDLTARMPEGSWEKGRLHTLLLEPQGLARMLLEQRGALTDVAVACLLMEGGRRYGRDWFDETLDRLTSALPS